MPAIPINGYLLQALGAGVEGESRPPVFEDWGGLLVDGILVWVVELVYVGIPGLLLSLVVGSFAVVADVSISTDGAPSAPAT